MTEYTVTEYTFDEYIALLDDGVTDDELWAASLYLDELQDQDWALGYLAG